MRVDFNRSPAQGGNFEMDLDAVPRPGDDVHVDGRSHKVGYVVWFLNDLDEPDTTPFARVVLEPTPDPCYETHAHAWY